MVTRIIIQYQVILLKISNNAQGYAQPMYVRYKRISINKTSPGLRCQNPLNTFRKMLDFDIIIEMTLTTSLTPFLANVATELRAGNAAGLT